MFFLRSPNKTRAADFYSRGPGRKTKCPIQKEWEDELLVKIKSTAISSRLLRFSDHRITRSPDHPILTSANLRSSAKVCG
jgi:hypothetical protein